MTLHIHNIIIREASIKDAQKLSEFIKKLDDENEFLLYDNPQFLSRLIKMVIL